MQIKGIFYKMKQSNKILGEKMMYSSDNKISGKVGLRENIAQ